MIERQRPRTREDLAQRAADGSDRFTALPEPPQVSDLVETSAASSARDPDGGRDPDTEWLIRYGAG